MFFIIGEDSQCADKFNEQLFFIDLPELLGRNQLSGQVDDRLLRWPSGIRLQADADEIRDHLDELEYELGDRLGLGRRPGVIGIERRLERQNAALYVYFDFNVRDWNDGQPQTELNFKFYRQSTNKIVGISDETADFLDGFF